MTYNFDARHGWNEVNVPADIETAVDVVAAKPNHKIVVRRIRGSAAENFQLYSGSTALGPVIVAGDNLDIPGLNYRTGVGKALRIDGGATDVNLVIQYAYVYSPLPIGDQRP